jgi:hypothetical protein
VALTRKWRWLSSSIGTKKDDSARLQARAVLPFEGELLLEHLARLGAPTPTERAGRDDAQLGVVANGKEGLSRRDCR